MSIGTLPYKDKIEVLSKSFRSLSESDQAKLSKAADDIVTSIKAKHPNAQITNDSALELLAAIGRMYIEQGFVLREDMLGQ